MMHRRWYAWPLLLLLAGCTEYLYRDGVEAARWPLHGETRYSLRFGMDSQVYLLDHRNNRETPLPFFTRKLSKPLTEKIRFSRDGRLLMVPVRNTFEFTSQSTLVLKVWDIEGHRLLKTAPISEELLMTSPNRTAQRTRDGTSRR